ncbi:AAA family ATPase [Sphingomonas sp. KC8]|uniref:AAA family ATPase n=1 Tax=Sphingomonas sp. KC8 TaxID=1030157 RepID=UPI000248A045|nr:AAA family ATPase [Sphingomonas sp. KC8]ARS29374.1 hypothetical protein KC8_19060 [Sphingomonas sp. KC8]
MNDESWTVRARAGGYSALAAANESHAMDWAVDGLLPATGATVVFGTGSTGKTQFLLWLAAHVAARDENRPKRWLGAKIRAKGQILVLSAEDLREHLFQRIGAIARGMSVAYDDADIDVEDLCNRIHVMPFLSMSSKEFPESNPALFGRGADGGWQPTSMMTHIERFIDDWNAEADAAGRPDDRFVGVILDSAVSMAGFEMAHSEATSNFLFHVNRMPRRQRVFWAIIGHTPKDARKKHEDAAIERLRGSAMWSTTPRAVLELRTAGPTDNIDQALTRYPNILPRDILYLTTAKANSMGADLRARALRRVMDGGFVDISEEFPNIFERSQKSGDVEKNVKKIPLDPKTTWPAVIDLIEKSTQLSESDGKFTRHSVVE